MLGLKNKREYVGRSCSIMINVVTAQGCCCGRWDVEFSPSGTVPAAFQNDEKVDIWKNKGFVEEVSSELTFRSKSKVVTGNSLLKILPYVSEEGSPTSQTARSPFLLFNSQHLPRKPRSHTVRVFTTVFYPQFQFHIQKDSDFSYSNISGTETGYRLGEGTGQIT